MPRVPARLFLVACGLLLLVIAGCGSPRGTVVDAVQEPAPTERSTEHAAARNSAAVDAVTVVNAFDAEGEAAFRSTRRDAAVTRAADADRYADARVVVAVSPPA